mmetsp:Transcript_60225/g.111654  ORF Transcript_60225/g.111654 Transcript_60225/m.111654 type:complete len:93 (+) Transcript_60225:67-345(+)
MLATFREFLLGGALGGLIGVVALKSHAMSTNSILFYMREVAAGRQTFTEYSTSPSMFIRVREALFDSRAWNRLVLDVHGKVLEHWQPGGRPE